MIDLLIEFIIALAGVSANREDDRSIVGESRLDREAKRLQRGCAIAIVLAAVAAGAIGYWKNWW